MLKFSVLKVTTMVLFSAIVHADDSFIRDVEVKIAGNVDAKLKSEINRKLFIQLDFLFHSIRLQKAVKAPWTIVFINDVEAAKYQLTGGGRTGYEFFWEGTNRRMMLLSLSAFLTENHPNLLTHELFHIVHFQNLPNEKWHKSPQNTFIKEGLALLGEYLTSEEVPFQVHTSYAYSYESSLTEDFNNLNAIGDEQNAAFGHAFLFFYYLYRNCGQEFFFNTLLTHASKAVGIEYMNEVLQASRRYWDAPFCESFKESFFAFEKARFTQNPKKILGFVFEDIFYPYKPRDSKPILTLPYSASAYTYTGRACPGNDIRVQNNVCLTMTPE